jgi:putative oxidoreductase
MEQKIQNLLKIYSGTIYAVFRIAFGLLFFQHGLQKIFGLFGGIDGLGLTPPMFGLIWWAGAIELVAGLGIALGLLTRLLASVSVLEMAYAYFSMHLPSGFFPIQNQGELALIYFFAFLLIAAEGSEKWGLMK